jgi:hypothetical protein
MTESYIDAFEKLIMAGCEKDAVESYSTKANSCIYPKSRSGYSCIQAIKLVYFTCDVEKGVFCETEQNDKLLPFIEDYFKARHPDYDITRLHDIIDFAVHEYKKCMDRHRMYKIYSTDIFMKDKTFKLYDMSTLKLKYDGIKDETFFKNPPMYIKDFNRFKEILVPNDFSTVFFFNQEENALLDVTTGNISLLTEITTENDASDLKGISHI